MGLTSLLSLSISATLSQPLHIKPADTVEQTPVPTNATTQLTATAQPPVIPSAADTSSATNSATATVVLGAIQSVELPLTTAAVNVDDNPQTLHTSFIPEVEPTSNSMSLNIGGESPVISLASPLQPTPSHPSHGIDAAPIDDSNSHHQARIESTEVGAGDDVAMQNMTSGDLAAQNPIMIKICPHGSSQILDTCVA
jgi:hypothetical protein